MAEFSSRMITSRRVEYVVRNPTIAEELGKAFNAIEKKFAALCPGRSSMGQIWIAATDEEIILYFDLDKRENVVPEQKVTVHVTTDINSR